MDTVTQRLQIAQELVQSLVNLLTLGTPPTRAVVQGILDSASARLKALESQEASASPLVVPNLVPAAKT